MPDAIDPNAQSADANDPNAQAEKPDPLANLPNIVNSAVASQLKRALGGLDKMIADAVGKASAGAPPPQPPPAQGDATKAIDPALAKLREELDSHKRELEAERKTRRETEERSRNERTEGALREALRKGVRAELLDGAFHALKARSLRFEEDGTPRLAISRSRERGRAAEEVAFSIEEGVADWLKSDEAKAYVPPPVAPPTKKDTAVTPRPLGADGKPRALSREEAISVSLAQASERGSRS